MDEVTTYNFLQLERLRLDYIERIEEIRNRYYVNYDSVKDKSRQPALPFFPIDPINKPDIPQDPIQSFELFANLYASIHCEFEIFHFKSSTPTINERALQDELSFLNEWITEADKMSFRDASHTALIPGWFDNSDENEKEYEYVKLKYGFYHGYCMGPEEHDHGSRSAIVYGKYFLFKKWLESELGKYQNEDETREDVQLSIDQTGMLMQNGSHEIQSNSGSSESLIPMEDDLISQFLRLDVAIVFHHTEISLKDNGYIDAGRKWEEEKIYLVGLLEYFKKNNYLLPTHTKSKSALNRVRRFFEDRYTVDIEELNQPARRRRNLKPHHIQVFETIVKKK